MKKLMLIILSLVLVACGGGGDSSLTGYFDGPAVQGLTYSTPTSSGTTDEKGTFRYQQGETVTFKLGEITIGSITGKTSVNPIDFGDTEESAPVAQLLFSLDSNRNPEDGLVDLSYIAVANTQGLTLTSLNDAVIAAISSNNSFTLWGAEYCYYQAKTYREKIFQEQDGKLKITSTLDSEKASIGHDELYSRYGVDFSDIDVRIISSDIAMTQATFSNTAQHHGRVLQFVTGTGKDVSGDDITVYGGLGIEAFNGYIFLNYFVEYSVNDIITRVSPAVDWDFKPELNQTYAMELLLTDTQVQAKVDGDLIKAWNLSDIPYDDDGVRLGEAYIWTDLYNAESGDTMVAEIDNLFISGLIDGDNATILDENFNDNTLPNRFVNFVHRFTDNLQP